MKNMHNSLLRLLLRADNLEARLSIIVLSCLMVVLVLALLAVAEVMRFAPEGVDAAFPWLMLIGAFLLLLLLGLLWLVIVKSVLKPLEQIRQAEQPEFRPGLGNIAATMRDLRNRVEQTQAELDESHKTLREVEKLSMVGKLAAGVAHSIRNPLTSVKLRLFSLERSLNLPDARTQDFRVIADSIKHIDAVLTNFLEFSRRPQLHLKKLDASEAVTTALQLLENRLSNFPVSVMRDRKPVLPVMADADQLHEALLNILLNACEAMNYDGNLYVREWMDDIDGKPFFHVSIRDSGPGIAEDILERVFIPFFSTKEQGTGLGLPIAKNILEEHEGDIFVASSPRTGTIFTLILPAKPGY